MKKFNFSLESVQKAKEVLDRQKVQQLTRVEQMKQKISGELAYLAQRQHHISSTYCLQTQNGITADNVQVYYRDMAWLKDIVSKKESALAGCKKEEAALMLELTEIRRDIKKLEILKEQKYFEYLAEVKAEEERFIDELVSFKESTCPMQEVE